MHETFFTADLHFDHRWMAEHRGYSSVEHMNEHMIEDWNALIGPRDDVFVLGDFSFGPIDRREQHFKRLAGKKHLIRGNHDRPADDDFGWASVQDFKRVKWNGYTFWCFHYPMLTWPNAHHGSFHLHGHSHGNLRAPTSTRMDVGIDATGLIAITARNAADILSERRYDYVDHHEVA